MYAGVQINEFPVPRGWEVIARPVPGFRGYFITKEGVVVTRRGIVIKTNISPAGYPRVSMYAGGDDKGRLRSIRRMLLHIMVACTWIGPRPSPGHIVAHGDGDKLNSHRDNLRWATYSENYEDARRHGTIKVGSKHRWAKLTEADVAVIKRRLRAGEPVVSISRDFPVTRSGVGHIKHRSAWKHVA
jgi:hypothetical protein